MAPNHLSRGNRNARWKSWSPSFSRFTLKHDGAIHISKSISFLNFIRLIHGTFRFLGSIVSAFRKSPLSLRNILLANQPLSWGSCNLPITQILIDWFVHHRLLFCSHHYSLRLCPCSSKKSWSNSLSDLVRREGGQELIVVESLVLAVVLLLDLLPLGPPVR